MRFGALEFRFADRAKLGAMRSSAIVSRMLGDRRDL
jgi:hypothetical protein